MADNKDFYLVKGSSFKDVELQLSEIYEKENGNTRSQRVVDLAKGLKDIYPVMNKDQLITEANRIINIQEDQEKNHLQAGGAGGAGGSSEEEVKADELESKPLLLLLGGNASGDIYKYGHCGVFDKYHVITSGTGVGDTTLKGEITDIPPCNICGIRCERRSSKQEHPFIDVQGDWNDPTFWIDLRAYLLEFYGRDTVDIVQFPQETQKYIGSHEALAIATNVKSIMEPDGQLFLNQLWIEEQDTGPTMSIFAQGKVLQEFLKVFDFDDSVLSVEERNAGGLKLEKKVVIKYGKIGDLQISRLGYPDWMRGRTLRPIHIHETPLSGGSWPVGAPLTASMERLREPVPDLDELLVELGAFVLSMNIYFLLRPRA